MLESNLRINPGKLLVGQKICIPRASVILPDTKEIFLHAPNSAISKDIIIINIDGTLFRIVEASKFTVKIENIRIYKAKT